MLPVAQSALNDFISIINAAKPLSGLLYNSSQERYKLGTQLSNSIVNTTIANLNKLLPPEIAQQLSDVANGTPGAASTASGLKTAAATAAQGGSSSGSGSGSSKTPVISGSAAAAAAVTAKRSVQIGGGVGSAPVFVTAPVQASQKVAPSPAMHASMIVAAPAPVQAAVAQPAAAVSGAADASSGATPGASDDYSGTTGASEYGQKKGATFVFG